MFLPDWDDSLPRYPDEERARLLTLSFATAINGIGLMGTIFPPDLYETGGYFFESCRQLSLYVQYATLDFGGFDR